MLQLRQPRRQGGVLDPQLLVRRRQVRKPRLQPVGVLDQLLTGQIIQARHMISKTGLGPKASTDTPRRSPHTASPTATTITIRKQPECLPREAYLAYINTLAAA